MVSCLSNAEECQKVDRSSKANGDNIDDHALDELSAG
jgi:hypothetical protein